jgi:N-acetylglucosaminyldiphosphoundecaprenol N-acetyl-beta-D-mannosaminyltransferase
MPILTDQVHLLGIAIDRVTAREALDRIFASIAAREGGWVITPNLDFLRRLAANENQFAELCSGATLRLADGMPLVWASRIQGTPLPERIAGSDLIWSICERAAREQRSVFFLGGNPGAADDAARLLAQKYAGLKVAGTLCPAPGFEKKPDEMIAIHHALEQARPDLVLVALGSPKQEALIQRLRAVLPTPWFLGIGISFSFVSGEVKRAPRWMQRVGLEWLHRLLQEPRRLARRYLVDGLPFAAKLAIGAFLKRLSGS